MITDKLALTLPPFGQSPWDVDVNNNFSQLEAVLQSFYTIPADFQGVWQNNTLYGVGQVALDDQTFQLYKVLVGHTSPASGTFLAARSATPANWELVPPANVNGWQKGASFSFTTGAATLDLLNLFQAGFDYEILISINSTLTAFGPSFEGIDSASSPAPAGSIYKEFMNSYATTADTRNVFRTEIGGALRLFGIAADALAPIDARIRVNNPESTTYISGTTRGTSVNATGNLGYFEAAWSVVPGAAWSGLRLSSLIGTTSGEISVLRKPKL